MAKLYVIVVLVSATLGLSSAGDADIDLSDPNNGFTFDLYRVLAKTPGNMVCSPFGLDVLLSNLMTGAKGDTYRELSTVLKYGNMSLSELGKAFKRKKEALKSSDGNQLSIASAVWTDKILKVNDDFQKISQDEFCAEQKSADFMNNPDSAVKDINGWVSNKTNGKIDNLVDHDAVNKAVMFLVSALYFKGKWDMPFEVQETYDTSFHNEDDSTSTAKMMYQKGSFDYTYVNSLQSQVLSMDYKGGAMSMMFFLPSNKTTLADVENSLTVEKFDNIISSLKSTRVKLYLPRFKIESSHDLISPMKAMGIVQATSPTGADFSGISPGQLYISKSQQKAVIQVNEEGTEAAAATFVEMMEGAFLDRRTYVTFQANHPFLYAMYHKPTKTVLFVGRLSDPSNKKA